MAQKKSRAILIDYKEIKPLKKFSKTVESKLNLKNIC